MGDNDTGTRPQDTVRLYISEALERVEGPFAVDDLGDSEDLGDEILQELMEYVDFGWLRMGYSAAKGQMVFWPTLIGSWVLGMELTPRWLAG